MYGVVEENSGSGPARNLLGAFFASLLLIVGLRAGGQPLDKQHLWKRIELTESLLQETVDQAEASVIQVNLLTQQIRLREQLIFALTREIDTLDRRITQTQEEMTVWENTLVRLKENYAHTVRTAYQSFHADNFWLSLLSAGSLSEAYYRSIYFVQFSRFRNNQLEQIRLKQAGLTRRNRELEEMKGAIQEQIDRKSAEIDKMIASRHTQENMVQSLRGQARNYQLQLREEQQILRNFIRSMDENFGQEGELLEMSDEGEVFSRQKGFHYWPVPYNRGIIIGKFGKSEDVFGNQIHHDGIYIRTPIGQSVRAIFQGEVTGVQEVPNQGWMVILAHGPFRSVYAHLAEVQVKKGMMLGANEVLGTVRTDPRTGDTTLHFLIYQIPATFVDPQAWIYTD